MASPAARSMSPSLLVTSEGPVRTLTLNRPARLNALDGELRKALVQGLEDAAVDPEVRAVVLTGAGERAFCAGQDLNESAGLSDADGDSWIETWRGFFLAFLRHQKPIIAAINGVAAGGGFEIANFADLRLAVPTARFIMAEVDIGLPTLVGSYILESHVFHSRMAEIVLTGRPMLADEAAEIGLVHRIVEPERLADEAKALALELAAKPPRAMALNVERLRAVWLRRMEQHGVFEALVTYQREAVASGEPQKVMAAFLAERARRRAARTGAA
jgi:enoyl-CoA hydratase/carnithine racemase